MKTRRFLCTVAAATAFAALSPALQAQTKEPVKASLRLKWLTQAQFAGFYYALNKGYYKDEGIDLTINPGGPNILAENMVASGADTFGLSGGSDSVFASVDKGLPIVSVGVSHQVTPFAFVVKADSPIKTLQDFQGKKVTTWFTGANYVLLGMLAKAGIDSGKVNMQPQQVTMTPFINGDVDVATATVYNEMWVVNDRLGAKNVRLFRAEDYGVTFPRDTLIVSRETARNKPELVKGFLRASIKGWREAMANPKEAVDMVMKISPTLNRAQQESMLTEAYKLMVAGKGKTEGLFHIDPAALQSAHDILLQGKVISKPVDVTVAFDGSFLKALSPAERMP